MLVHNRLQKGDKVLVTGVTGFLGAAVANDLLSRGFLVRGVTRDIAKAKLLNDKIVALYGSGVLELVQISNPTEPDAYQAALEGVSGLIHLAVDLASAFGTTLEPDVPIRSAIDMTLGVLRSAAKVCTIKSAVVCSSLAAIFHPQPGRAVEISASQYNEIAISLAYDLPPNHALKGFSTYIASKTRAEQELWSWVSDVKPTFAVNTVLPAFVLGPPFNPGAEFSSSSSWLLSLFKGQVENNPMVGIFAAPTWFVDVRDTAVIHVATLLATDINHERVTAAGHPPNSRDSILPIWRKAFPERQIVPDFDFPEPDCQALDRTLSTELLKRYANRDWLPFEKTVLDNVVDQL